MKFNFATVSLRVLSLVTIGLFSAGSRATGFDYIGKDSNEAQLKFSSQVIMNVSEEPTREEARDAVISQMDYLFGPMSYGEFKAVPKGNYRVSNIQLEHKSAKMFIASYDVSMRVAIESRVKNVYTVTLPVNPDRIYNRGMVGEKNLCTDDHYQSDGDFWYFWSPDRPGCTLVKDRDYILVEAKVTPIANTEKTYAEFDRMADADGVVTIDMLWGLNEPDSNSWNPDKSEDVNAENYRYVAKQFKKMGFSVERESLDQIQEVTGVITSKEKPTVDVFTKEYPAVKGRNVKKVVVTMFFGASGIDEESSPFHYYVKKALETSTMMVYAGHSGLGAHLDLKGLEESEGFKIKFDKARYQILYFNSCTSYTYYNTQYFSKKRTQTDVHGTKNLDIVTNGLSTYFSSIDESNLEMVRGIDNWAQKIEPLSFQDMARKMDSENLLGFNGDEDNPAEVPSSK